MEKLPRFAALAILPLLTNSYAGTAIVAVSGQIQIVVPPLSVQWQSLESDTTGIVFQEQSDYQLLADTRVSIPGTIGTYNKTADMRPTDILAGTTVDSYLLHFDASSGNPRFQGTVQFTDPIIGVMLLPFALSNSDTELGSSGTSYPPANPFFARRGLDFSDCQQHRYVCHFR